MNHTSQEENQGRRELITSLDSPGKRGPKDAEGDVCTGEASGGVILLRVT